MVVCIRFQLCLISLSFASFCFAGIEKKLEHEGIERKYIIHLPQNFDEKNVYPLVIFLHGAGGNSQLASKSYGWEEQADISSFIVIFPEATPIDMNHEAQFSLNPNLWNDGSGRGNKTVDDIGYLKKLIDLNSAHYPIDSNKIYVTGFSNGASLAFRAGIELADTLAAIAPVMGHLFVKDPEVDFPPSLFYLVGGQDPLNPLKGGYATNPWQQTPKYKPPMVESLNVWLKLLKIDPSQNITQHGMGVTTSTYGPNADGKKAVYVILEDQGHQWPNSVQKIPQRFAGFDVTEYNATEKIWNFFDTQKLTLETR